VGSADVTEVTKLDSSFHLIRKSTKHLLSCTSLHFIISRENSFYPVKKENDVKETKCTAHQRHTCNGGLCNLKHVGFSKNIRLCLANNIMLFGFIKYKTG